MHEPTSDAPIGRKQSCQSEPSSHRLYDLVPNSGNGLRGSSGGLSKVAQGLPRPARINQAPSGKDVQAGHDLALI